MTGIYTINAPNRLFGKLVHSFTAFCESPSEDGIFEVIFPLYHLREWICPGGHNSYKNKPEAERSQGEKLHAYLHTMHEYAVVRSLCNAAKHYNAESLDGRTDICEGFRAGLSRAGDSLGETHYLVDGHDIRDIFSPVLLVYYEYFNTI